ncbi:putative aminotransferase [Gordonia effusa NBRC 100432]|uniref:Aminotransferase n=1 Tax=Gordonia effusa NBRC 100432 TaxID=1077974 RepID=H0R2B7_9ACTN|nr:Rv2231c family pyridoxal phosphate-dependent protein CobC [Gordonia effusa]GAB19218.1 putative aminotransferase [Gordonia effusa NBRC 100432]
MKSAHTPAADLFEPGRHGDEDAEPGLIDFSVNVRGGPPDFVRAALTAEIDSLASYPSAAQDLRVRTIVGAAHGRGPDEVLLLAGAAEGFELLTHLRPSHAALIVPSFTEPGRVLSAAAITTSEVRCIAPDWRIDPALVPDDADLVVLGNPTNPTSVLHPRSDVNSLRREGRVVVVDEAFADLTCRLDEGGDVVMEPESVAAQGDDDIIVVRSITKTFGLAGLRAGYLLAAPTMISRLTRTRRHWALGSLAIAAIGVCLDQSGLDFARAEAVKVSAQRAAMCARLAKAGIEIVAEPSAPFVTIAIPGALAVKERLRHKGFAVRSCANFVGLGPDYMRLAVRPEADVAALVAALGETLVE